MEVLFPLDFPSTKARVEGIMTVAGKEEKVSGWGYHDHHWGTVSVLDAVKDWSWGRIYLMIIRVCSQIYNYLAEQWEKVKRFLEILREIS